MSERAKRVADKLVLLGWDLRDDAVKKCYACNAEVEKHHRYCHRCGSLVAQCSGETLQDIEEALKEVDNA